MDSTQPIPIDRLDKSLVGKTVIVWGWVRTSRHQKNIGFVKMFDSATSEVQVVIDYKSKKFSDITRQIQTGWTIEVSGVFKDSPGPGQPFEINADKIEVFGDVGDQATYPMAKTDHTMEYLRQHPQLECRDLKKATIYSLRSEIMKLTHEFYHDQGFHEAVMPLITFSECEGGCQPMQCTLLLSDKKHSSVPRVTQQSKDGIKTEVDEIDFSKDFFGSRAFLTVSGQLELETQLPLGPVYTITTAVRGEPSMTTKHLCEFRMLEIEMLSRSSNDIINVTERYIKHILSTLLAGYGPQLKYLESVFEQGLVEKLDKCAKTPFVRTTHAECVTILLHQQEKVFDILPSYSEDLETEHERYLVDVHFKSPVVVTRYPKKIKAFYMPVIQESEDESHGVEHVDCFDILVPGLGELVGGSQRIHKLDELEHRINELGLDRVALEFYIDLRRKGTIPHGGMGLGIERLVKYITGAPSVRDCVPFPRFYKGAKVKQE